MADQRDLKLHCALVTNTTTHDDRPTPSMWLIKMRTNDKQKEQQEDIWMLVQQLQGHSITIATMAYAHHPTNNVLIIGIAKNRMKLGREALEGS